jgi:hypothetical protein
VFGLKLVEIDFSVGRESLKKWQRNDSNKNSFPSENLIIHSLESMVMIVIEINNSRKYEKKYR